MGLVGSLQRRQRDARPARAQHHGRDGHMKTVETSGCDKARQGIGPAFDQHAAHPQPSQRRRDVARSYVSVLCRQRNDFNSGRSYSIRLFSGDQHAANAIVSEQSWVRT